MAKRAAERTPAEVIAGECIAVRMRALNRAITGLYDDALRPHGLRVGQLNLLVAIARMGSASPGDLCRILHMDKSTLSRDLDLLRRNGWIETGESRGRARLLKLGRDGLALLEQLVPAWRHAQEQARQLIGDQGADAIVQMARRLRSDDAPGL
jgi:DNA-binding MarR family transcriptional regulator